MGWISELFGLIGKGGIIMVPIFLCSIIALAIVIERIIFFRKYFVDVEGFFNPVLKLIREGHADQVLDRCKKKPNPLGRIIEAGLDEKDIPRWKLEEKLTLAGQEEINSLEKNIRGLEVIATISPLMGLLGTVIGMVQAFNKVAEFEGQVDPSLLAGGIWEALLTTAAGLSVAIPTVIMLHYFDRKKEKLAFSLNKYGQQFIYSMDAKFYPDQTTRIP
ncbi:MAG: biopolymer transporter ExbB [Nitrospinae bacterium CG22_combo_CG10-13_8_21_14_all_47_10]|nr:MAG: biopolymer transporter ExbB [Nitrospinae bacterium CG22_combo_CG10-13_8_21_14_all_47_10]